MLLLLNILFVAIGIFLLTACGKPSSAPGQARPSATASTPPQLAQELFKDVTSQSGILFNHQLADGKMDNIMESDGAGGAVLDFDNDGWMDIYLVNSGPAPVLSDAPSGTIRQPNRLFRNRGNGTFEDVTQKAGVAGSGFGTTAAAADYDNDGDTDLLVVNFGSVILYQNLGNGSFKDVTQSSGISTRQAGISAAFFDADKDGLLDLFVANYLVYDQKIKVPPGTQTPYPGPLAYDPELNLLYRNRGNGTFEDVSKASGIQIPGHRAMSVTVLDFNRDGDQDLYISNDGTANLLMVNDGKGRFQDEALRRGVAFNQFGEAAGSMGAAVGDCNGDGLPDLLVTRFGNASLYINSSSGIFDDRIMASGILNATAKLVGWGGNFLDYDNAGDLDIFMATGDPHFMIGSKSLLLKNNGKALFTDETVKAGRFFQQPHNSRGSGCLDFDNDGRIDVLITTLGGPAILLHNSASNSNHWLKLNLKGSKSPRDGFGAKIKLQFGNKTIHAESTSPTTYLFQNDPRLHFGLGLSTSVDLLEVSWPSGQIQKLTNLQVNRILNVQEP